MCNVELIKQHPTFTHLMVCYDGTIYRRTNSPDSPVAVYTECNRRVDKVRGTESVRIPVASGLWRHVASLVAECYLGKDIDSRSSYLYKDGNLHNCAADNLVLTTMFCRTLASLNGSNEVILKCAKCACDVPAHSGERFKLRNRTVCESCFNASKYAVARRIVTKGNRKYKKCANCGETRPVSHFDYGTRSAELRIYCKFCATGTGPFMSGRSTDKFHVVPRKIPRVFKVGERRPDCKRTALIEKLEDGQFPYTTDGKIASLELVGRISRTLFNGVARFLLMPNYGKEVAVYARMGNVFRAARSVFVERDPAFRRAMSALLCCSIMPGMRNRSTNNQIPNGNSNRSPRPNQTVIHPKMDISSMATADPVLPR